MNVCFIGNCGNHSINVFSALKKYENVNFCGFAPSTDHDDCPNPDFAPYFSDYRKMLDVVKPGLVVSSPIYSLTPKIASECAERGIDVISEKPVATSFESLETLSRAVKANGIRFTAMHFLRFNKAFYTAGQLVRAGRIGEVKLITAQKSYRYGNRPEWYKKREFYGGTIPWIGIHAIDWISFFTNGEKFISVDARHSENPEKSAVCLFETESGIGVTVNLDYYRGNGSLSHGDDRIRCVGTKGIIEVSDGKIRLIDDSTEKFIEPEPSPDLVDEFMSGKDPINVDEIFYLTYVALKARESADKKQPLGI